MSMTHVKNVVGVFVALAAVLVAAPGAVTAQSVTLPTGWKTASELYATLAKLPADQIDTILYEGAKKEGAVIYASPAEEKQIAKLMEGFMKKYPGISGKGMGGQQEDLSNRIIAESRAGRSTFDVISVGTELGEYRKTKALAELYDLVGNARYPAKFRGPDFYSWNLLSMVIAYNTKMVQASDVPQGYNDLLDPKWKGKIGVDNSPDTWIFGMLNKWGIEKTNKIIQHVCPGIDNAQ